MLASLLWPRITGVVTVMTVALAIPLVPSSEAEIEPPHPRVLVVDIDDVGAEFLDTVPTPNLDRLGRLGRRYTRFYTTGNCSPSRTQLQLGASGGYPGVECLNRLKPAEDYFVPWDVVVPLAVAVRDAGFTTAKVGKWHLAPGRMGRHPNEFGWTDYRGLPGNVTFSGAPYYNYRKRINGTVVPISDRYLTTDETDDAIAHVERGVDLISVSYHAIHRPYHVPPTGLFTGPTPTTSLEKATAVFEALDHELGRLVAAALQRDYLVIVLSDNGGRRQLRGAKGTLGERGIRTPMWVVGPGVTPGLDSSLVSAVDVYATVLEVLGVPKTTAMGPDSVSFAPTFSGDPGARDWVFSEMAPTNGVDPASDPSTWRRTAVGHRYKLLREGAADALHDLTLDPDETTNLLEGSPSADALDAYGRLGDVVDRLGSR